ncbi:hypothetical protein QQ056_17765 [Oscillatoria laete-virens NRMC-F 0139]|nr:hypothetical protein [Oscillatoria laete-virens NRMC-F 0139]
MEASSELVKLVIIAIAAPGHTPGQSALEIESEGSQLIVAADVFFNEAFDLEHPDWQTGFDLNPQQAAETRRRLLNQIANGRIMVIAYHMPFPALGHIRLQNGTPNTHPLFTGICPKCGHLFDRANPPPVHWDCPECGWVDDSV